VSLSCRQLGFIYFLSILIIFLCQTLPAEAQGRGRNRDRETDTAAQPSQGSLSEEIKNLTESGVLSSMLNALELITARNQANSDFGRLMIGVNVSLIKMVYPDSPARLPVIDLPVTHNYTRIIREAEKGVYVRPDASSADFLEYILPFMAVNAQTSAEIFSNILIDLQKAGEIKPDSIFPFYLRGVVLERLNRNNEASSSYRTAYEISNECYPAQIGVARLRRISGAHAEAASILSDLSIRYPDSIDIKRELALAYYAGRDWSRAVSLVDDILRADPRNGEFLLIRTTILIEQGQFTQANTSLDAYASINPNNRSYLFMRARVQAEGNRNRDSALNYLRSILRSNPNDTEAMIYAVPLLLESQRTTDVSEGREILERLRRALPSSVDVLNLSLRDAVSRENWQEAQSYLNRILASRRTDQDLTDGYNIERGLRNNARALNFARELYERNTNNNDYTAIYISALIDNNRRDEASRLLESRFNSAAAGQVKSRYYFLRSRLRGNIDDALGDLRSSLFEDPRNLDAIIAMFEIYHNRREERRAVHYLRQALAIAPNHPLLRRYEQEYSALLGRQ